MDDANLESYLIELSESQRNELNHFKEIAGNMETAECIRILEEHGWDLEGAVNQLMGLGSTHSVEATALLSEESVDDRRRENDIAVETLVETLGVRQRIPLLANVSDTSPLIDRDPPNPIFFQRPLPPVDVDSPFVQIVTYEHRVTTWEWVKYIVLGPVHVAYGMFRAVYLLLMSLFQNRQYSLTDPVQDVNRFVDFFKETYGQTNLHVPGNGDNNIPDFYRNTYAEALKRARQELKFLMVYLHGDSHEDSDAFCRNILCHPQFVQFLSNSNEIVPWACNVQSGEGYRVSQALRTHTYPFLGLIVLNSSPSPLMGNRSPRPNRMTLVGRIEGYDQALILEKGSDACATELVGKIRSIMRNNEATLVTAKVDREERELAQRLRAEQDREYQESLRQDRERFEAKERAQSVALEKDQSEKRQKQLLLQMRLAVRDSMPSDITCENVKAGVSQTQDKELAGSDRVRILVRLPDGVRLQCSYPRNVSCKVLYLSIFALEHAPENFTIFTNFPKREIPCNVEALKGPFKDGCEAAAHTLWLPSSYDPPSFADLGFSKSETVMVIDLDA